MEDFGAHGAIDNHNSYIAVWTIQYERRHTYLHRKDIIHTLIIWTYYNIYIIC